MTDASSYDAVVKAHPTWQLPTYEVDELAPKKHDYCVVVFVINEGDRARQQLAAMQPLAETIDIVVADGGSTDGSLDLAYLRDHDVRALLTKTGAGKLSAQMRMAFAWALIEEYQGVVVVDGNGKDDISAVPHFVHKLEVGYDHVQGSRFVPGGHAINTPRFRLLGLKLLHAPLFTVRTGHKHTDTTNGFRAYSVKLLSSPAVNVFRDMFVGYELHYHLDLEAHLRGEFRTCEIPVTRTYPKTGHIPTKISGVRGNLAILRTLLTTLAGRYRYRG